jgi:hypothetical protein
LIVHPGGSGAGPLPAVDWRVGRRLCSSRGRDDPSRGPGEPDAGCLTVDPERVLHAFLDTNPANPAGLGLLGDPVVPDVSAGLLSIGDRDRHDDKSDVGHRPDHEYERVRSGVRPGDGRGRGGHRAGPDADTDIEFQSRDSRGHAPAHDTHSDGERHARGRTGGRAVRRVAVGGVDDPGVPGTCVPADCTTDTVRQNTPTPITLQASDSNGNPLNPVAWVMLSSPAHGTLSGTAPSLTYTPATGYLGPDSLTFTAADGSAVSNVAAISITVVGCSHTAPTLDTTVSADRKERQASSPHRRRRRDRIRGLARDLGANVGTAAEAVRDAYPATSHDTTASVTSGHQRSFDAARPRNLTGVRATTPGQPLGERPSRPGSAANSAHVCRAPSVVARACSGSTATYDKFGRRLRHHRRELRVQAELHERPHAGVPWRCQPGYRHWHRGGR